MTTIGLLRVKFYLFFKLKAKTCSEKVSRDYINYRLGSSMVEKTRLNTNSQKVESGNNVIRHALPKNVTSAKKF